MVLPSFDLTSGGCQLSHQPASIPPASAATRMSLPAQSSINSTSSLSGTSRTTRRTTPAGGPGMTSRALSRRASEGSAPRYFTTSGRMESVSKLPTTTNVMAPASPNLSR